MYGFSSCFLFSAFRATKVHFVPLFCHVQRFCGRIQSKEKALRESRAPHPTPPPPQRECIFRISNLNKIKGSGFYFFLFPPPLSAMQGRFFR